MIHTAATLDDLMRFDGKAELISGRIVPIMPSGYLPVKIARRITRSLEDFVMAGASGEVIADPTAYGFDQPLPSGRQSFCPDASFYTGPPPNNLMGYIRGFPIFAVEVRSENDYGPAMDRKYEEKRTDYFTAGTEIVWDVDPEAKTITAYTAGDPTQPVEFGLGDTADAEPVLPGWRLNVTDLFS
jgi:Uma2 family endonuclease